MRWLWTISLSCIGWKIDTLKPARISNGERSKYNNACGAWYTARRWSKFTQQGIQEHAMVLARRLFKYYTGSSMFNEVGIDEVQNWNADRRATNVCGAWCTARRCKDQIDKWSEILEVQKQWFPNVKADNHEQLGILEAQNCNVQNLNRCQNWTIFLAPAPETTSRDQGPTRAALPLCWLSVPGKKSTK